MDPLAALTTEELERLLSLGFDPEPFSKLARALAAGALPPNEIQGEVQPPPAGSIRPTAPPTSWQGDALHDVGLHMLYQGRVGLIVLNGGMATRFGGRVKGVVDALPGRSFLALQLSRLAALAEQTGQPAPLLVMNSEATHEPTLAHLEGLPQEQLREHTFCFVQSASPRLRPDGSLYRDSSGAISLHGPGHGDLLPSLQRSGALQWARERGIEYLLMANVDNLGAALDPGLLGRFVGSEAEMMVEVAPKLPGDKGGAPAEVDGRLKIVEGFAFPEAFDPDRIPVFNTNTLWFRTDALDRDFPLRWYVVRKDVGGEEVVQFERLVGQASWFLETEWAEVGRDRFLPVKTQADLEALQPKLRELFGTRLEVL